MIFNMTGGGGGAGLNFKVVGNPQPSAPVENTIWVNTDTAVNSWVFSAKEPQSPVSGMVWIPTDNSGPVAFNALKKNNITVCPIGAKQYSGGAWVDKEAKVYYLGQWVDAKRPILYLYDNGTVSEAAGSVATDGQNGFTLNETTLSIYSIGNYAWGHVYFSNPIDLTPYDTLTLVGSMRATTVTDYRGEIVFGAFRTLGSEAAAGISGTLEQGTHTVDVSGLTGAHYISFYLKGFDANQIEGGVATAEAAQIYLEGGTGGGNSGGEPAGVPLYESGASGVIPNITKGYANSTFVLPGYESTALGELT